MGALLGPKGMVFGDALGPRRRVGELDTSNALFWGVEGAGFGLSEGGLEGAGFGPEGFEGDGDPPVGLSPEYMFEPRHKHTHAILCIGCLSFRNCEYIANFIKKEQGASATLPGRNSSFGPSGFCKHASLKADLYKHKLCLAFNLFFLRTRRPLLIQKEPC